MPAAEIEFKMLKARAAARARTPAKTRALRAESFETLEPRFAFGVDLAPVEGGAFFLVAQNFIGGAHLGEFLLRLRILALIWMKFLGEFAKDLFDLGHAGRFLNSQNRIRITHRLAHFRARPSAGTSARVFGKIGAQPTGRKAL